MQLSHGLSSLYCFTLQIVNAYSCREGRGGDPGIFSSPSGSATGTFSIIIIVVVVTTII